MICLGGRTVCLLTCCHSQTEAILRLSPPLPVMGELKLGTNTVNVVLDKKYAVWNTAETCFWRLPYCHCNDWIQPSIRWPIHPSFTSLILSGVEGCWSWNPSGGIGQQGGQHPPQVASFSRSATQTQRTIRPIWKNQLSPNGKKNNSEPQRFVAFFLGGRWGGSHSPSYQIKIMFRAMGGDDGMINPE